ncbi:metal-dependent hydrolase [Aliifodinibius salipaludis]|uniref:Metal-dependent hydrolase n=1 Tax=Fodinibius salipaludis TaxID=2032627 RepID=A0A2A2GEQ6_9BACT|nr:SprT family zinc-dependent metalloprotease [Aliifodinibius salipaludis]PAU95373.1 metal-dependent hydrolase [Aliifodinibius salipaludis]
MNTEQTQITVSGIDIDVIKKDIKNMHLSVHPPTGRVRISSPKEMETKSIRLFAVSKLGWIKKHIRNMQEQDRQPEREYIQRESHYFQGQRYLLNIIEHDAPPKVEIRNKKYMDLYVRPGSDREKKREVVKEFYRSELKKQIPPLIEKWEEKMGVQVNDWLVRQMKTKWGSCNTDEGRIILNLELAKKAPECLEYVVVHEMVHLQERLHTERFKALLEKYMPSWKERREELNELVF